MEEIAAVVNSTVVLHCDVTGQPTPAVSWLRDGQPVQLDPQHQISKEGTQLQVSPIRPLERNQSEKSERVMNSFFGNNTRIPCFSYSVSRFQIWLVIYVSLRTKWAQLRSSSV